MYFSHWEYEALEEMDFNSTSSSFLFTTVNMGVVFTPVYQSTPVSATKIETSDVALNVKCYPNPVEDIATISITTGQPWDIDAVLFDIQGTKIRSVCNGYFPAGKQTFTLLKENLKPGIYILCVKTNGTQENVKILFK